MESKTDWRKKADIYFHDGLKISEIAVLLDVSRQSISAYLKTLPDYKDVKEQQKKENARKRRIYKTEKQRSYRAADSLIMAVTPETVRREHELAAMELSRERYH